MWYSMIYSVDVPADCDPLNYAPPNVKKLWDQTEGDEQYELSYLEGCWEGGHHRKWCTYSTSGSSMNSWNTVALSPTAQKRWGAWERRGLALVGRPPSLSIPAIPMFSKTPT